MKKLLGLILSAALAVLPVSAAEITQFPPGFALQNGSHLNQIVDAVNNLTGNGTAGAVVGTTGTFSSTVSAAGLRLGTTDFTEAALALYAKGVAAGYKVARGAGTLDGSNPTPIATGLTTVISCTTDIATSVAPGVSTMLLTNVITTATMNVYGWKPTDATNNTLVASTGTDPFYWICVGT